MKRIKLGLFFTICSVGINSKACQTIYGLKKSLGKTDKLKLKRLSDFLSKHKNSKCRCVGNTVVCRRADSFKL